MSNVMIVNKMFSPMIILNRLYWLLVCQENNGEHNNDTDRYVSTVPRQNMDPSM